MVQKRSMKVMILERRMDSGDGSEVEMIKRELAANRKKSARWLTVEVGVP